MGLAKGVGIGEGDTGRAKLWVKDTPTEDGGYTKSERKSMILVEVEVLNGTKDAVESLRLR